VANNSVMTCVITSSQPLGGLLDDAIFGWLSRVTSILYEGTHWVGDDSTSTPSKNKLPLQTSGSYL